MDTFKYKRKELDSPADTHWQIVPSDTVDVSPKPRSIYCREAGDIVIRDGAGTELTYTMAVGDELPFRAKRILATGTTGTFYGWE